MQCRSWCLRWRLLQQALRQRRHLALPQALAGRRKRGRQSARWLCPECGLIEDLHMVSSPFKSG